jgi:hypothetical protein
MTAPTPVRPGVADLDRVVLDPEIDGPCSLALDDDGVVAGILELGTERAAGVGGRERVVQRALGDDVVASGRRRERAREGPGREHELVGR